MLIFLTVAALFAQAAPAADSAPQAAPTAQAAATKPAPSAKPAKPKVVCYDESDTGSFISHRVCRPVGKADAAEDQSRREHDALVDHLAACHGQPSC